MHKGMGKAQQQRGHKRYKKNFARKQRKHDNILYLVELLKEHGSSLKLKHRPTLGEKYWNSISSKYLAE